MIHLDGIPGHGVFQQVGNPILVRVRIQGLVPFPWKPAPGLTAKRLVHYSSFTDKAELTRSFVAKTVKALPIVQKAEKAKLKALSDAKKREDLENMKTLFPIASIVSHIMHSAVK